MANVVKSPQNQHTLYGSWANLFNWFVKTFSAPGRNVIRYTTGSNIGSAVPAGNAAISVAPWHSPEYPIVRGIYAASGWILSGFIGIFMITFFVGTRTAQRVLLFLSDAVDWLTVLKPPKYSRSKWVIIKIGWRIIHWPYYLVVVFFNGIKLFFNASNIAFLAIMLILVATFLQLEVYQNEILDYIDYILIIGKDGINIVSAILNVVAQIVSIAFVPIANAMINFVVQCFLITKDYIVPIYLKSVEEVNAEGRRRLDPASIAFFGKEFFLILESTGAIFSGLINILLSFYIAMWGVVNWLFFAAFGDEVGDVLKIMLQFVQGFYCYLEPDYLYCTLAQAVQSVIFFIALIINGVIGIIFSILPFGIGAPRVPTDFFNVQCESTLTVSGRTVSPEECIRCRPAFPGWINSCPDESARRSLKIYCDDFTRINGTWSERVYFESELIHTPAYYNHTSNWNGCPMSKQGILYNDLGMHYKYGGFNDCYDIILDGVTYIQCPFHNGVLASNRRRLSRERNLLSLADELTKQKSVTATKQEGTLIDRQSFLNGYTKIVNAFSWDTPQKTAAVFNCSDHSPTNHTNVFDTLCAIQSLASRKEVVEEVGRQYNPSKKHESNVYAKFRHSFKETSHRTLEEDSYQKIIYANEKINELKHLWRQRRRRRVLKSKTKVTQLVNITAADGQCPPGGYKKCPNSPYCEIVNACECPSAIEPFQNDHELANYNYYQTMCQIQMFSFSQWTADTIACWDKYRTRDTSTPWGSFISPITNAGGDIIRTGQNFKKDVVYCFPLIDPTNWLIPEIKEGFSLRNYYATKYCNDVKTNFVVSECMCPGYLQGVNAEGGYWLTYIEYYIYARMFNWWEVNRQTFFAAFNTLCIGIINYIWSGFWRPFGAREFWTGAFSESFSIGNIFCALFHSGSWGYGNVLLFVWALFYFGCCFTPFWYWATDIAYILLVLVRLDTTVNRFNEKHGEQVQFIEELRLDWRRQQKAKKEEQKEEQKSNKTI